MKKTKNIIIFFLCSFGFYICSSFDYELQEKQIVKKEKEIIKKEKNKEDKKTKKTDKNKKKKEKKIKNNFEIFADSLSFKESSWKEDTVHPVTGCVGLFQFCSNRAADFKITTKDIRKMNKQEQRLLFKRHVRDIKKNLGKENYLLLKKKGFSDGSIVAIAHLGGVTGLKKYAKLGGYKQDYNPSDGYTRLSDYDAKHAKYDGFLSEI